MASQNDSHMILISKHIFILISFEFEWFGQKIIIFPPNPCVSVVVLQIQWKYFNTLVVCLSGEHKQPTAIHSILLLFFLKSNQAIYHLKRCAPKSNFWSREIVPWEKLLIVLPWKTWSSILSSQVNLDVFLELLQQNWRQRQENSRQHEDQIVWGMLLKNSTNDPVSN